MTSGQFITHCRTHLKAWISLVVIVQCLVLILYLIIVSDKETTQQPPLARKNHVVTQKGNFLQTDKSTRPAERGQITIRNLIKEHLKYPAKHVTHQRAIADHLNLNADLKNANDILYRKIGKKKRKPTPKLADRREEVLKKALMQQARWAEKAERHRKQKLEGIKARNRVNNTSKSGALDLPQFDIKVIRENRNDSLNSKTIGRELKKFISESTTKSKEKVINNDKLILGSHTRSFVSRITDLVKEKLTTNDLTSEIIKAKHEEHFNNPTAPKNIVNIDKEPNVATVSSDNNLTSINVANISLFVSIPKVFQLDDAIPTAEYFETRKTTYSTHQCYKPGTRPQVGPEDFLCSCEKGWHGKWCSFPDSLYYSGASQ